MTVSARFFQVDVFAERAGGGNPLGVVLDADDWDTARMQSFAAWTNLVETTFVLPATDPHASYRLRIFTPTREIAFAGHPTIGSAHAALEAGLVQAVNGRLIQQCGAGLLPIRVQAEGAARLLLVQTPGARLLPSSDSDSALVAGILHGQRLGRHAPALVEGGRRWWLAEFADESGLRSWQPAHSAIAALARNTDSLGLCACARSSDPQFELVVRAFPAGVGIVEDPASGAANGLLAAWLRQLDPAGPLSRGYRVSQGREIGRDARLLIEYGSDGEVWVGGSSHVVIRGNLSW